MDRFSNIFSNITDENEDTSSELLCNILRTKYIRDLTLGYLGISPESLETIELEHISTRKSIDDGGIPDIIINNDENFFLIENKIHIDTDLQESQTTTYPKFIDKKDKIYKSYIFLIPKNYKHEPEIDKTKKLYPFITKKYWEDLLDYLYKMEIQKESPVISEAMDFLNYLLSNEFVIDTKLNNKEVVIMYETEELYHTLETVDKIARLVADVADSEKIKNLGKGFSYCSAQKDKNFVGVSLKYEKSKPSVFLGLFPLLWGVGINGEFVYSVAFNKKELKENYYIDEKYPKHTDDEEDGFLYIKLDRKTLVEEDQESVLVERVVDIIKNVFLENIK